MKLRALLISFFSLTLISVIFIKTPSYAEEITETEPNNELSEATPLRIGEIAKFEAHDGDIDYFVVSFEGNKRYRVWTNIGKYEDFGKYNSNYLKIYDSNGRELYYTDDNSSELINGVDFFDMTPEKGDYYFRFSPCKLDMIEGYVLVECLGDQYSDSNMGSVSCENVYNRSRTNNLNNVEIYNITSGQNKNDYENYRFHLKDYNKKFSNTSMDIVIYTYGKTIHATEEMKRTEKDYVIIPSCPKRMVVSRINGIKEYSFRFDEVIDSGRTETYNYSMYDYTWTWGIYGAVLENTKNNDGTTDIKLTYKTYSGSSFTVKMKLDEDMKAQNSSVLFRDDEYRNAHVVLGRDLGVLLYDDLYWNDVDVVIKLSFNGKKTIKANTKTLRTAKKVIVKKGKKKIKTLKISKLDSYLRSVTKGNYKVVKKN